tara:strand:- start:99 stop:371 length:273 start_codon:yes stop_codon:yes gene_type:complete
MYDNEHGVTDISSYLGITPEDLQGKSVLDLGCGKNSLFVAFLRENGIDAEGIDPLVSANEFLIRGDAMRIPRTLNIMMLFFHTFLFLEWE